MCQGLGRKNKHEVLKTDRSFIGKQLSKLIPIKVFVKQTHTVPIKLIRPYTYEV